MYILINIYILIYIYNHTHYICEFSDAYNAFYICTTHFLYSDVDIRVHSYETLFLNLFMDYKNNNKYNI